MPGRPVVLRNRQYGILWASQLQSNIGSGLLVLAVPVYVFLLTGSPLSTGLAFLAETVPALFIAPFAGLIADRLDRRLVMVAADAASAASVACMLLAHRASLVWVIYLAVFAENCFGQLFRPACSAIVPAIVTRGADLDEANGWSTVSIGIVGLISGPLGGLLYGAAGFGWLVVADCASYVVSAALLLTLRRPCADPPAPVGSSGGPDAAGIRAQLLEGARFTGRDAMLRALLAVWCLFLFTNAALTVILVPFVLRVLHQGPGQFGLLLAALGGGFLAGGFTGRRLSARGLLRGGTSACLAGVTIAFAGLFNARELPFALASTALAGACGGALMLLIRVQVQRRSPDWIIGRVSSSFASAQTVCELAGAVAGGALATVIGVVPTADLVLVPVAAAAGLALLLVPASQVRPAAPLRSARPWRSRPRRDP